MRIEIDAGVFQGYVILHNPLTIYQAATFEENVFSALKMDEGLKTIRSHQMLIPSIMECVKEWHVTKLEGVTVDTFPGMGVGIPRKDVAKLVNDIVNALLKYFKGDDPNA